MSKHKYSSDDYYEVIEWARKFKNVKFLNIKKKRGSTHWEAVVLA